MLETASKLLLSSTADGADLRTVDPETQARLEALLEAAGKYSCPIQVKSQSPDTWDHTGTACISLIHTSMIYIQDAMQHERGKVVHIREKKGIH